MAVIVNVVSVAVIVCMVSLGVIVSVNMTVDVP